MSEVSLPIDGLIVIIVVTIIATMLICAAVRAVFRHRKAKRDEYEELKTLAYRADEILTGQSHYGFSRRNVKNGLEYRVSQIEQGLGIEPAKKNSEEWVY